jgi:SAM-dependent methyltransferase
MAENGARAVVRGELWESDAADRFHQARASSGVQARLWAEAFGDEYPAEVDPSSACTWSVLGGMVRELRLRPDATLVDLGCGRGGTGLWLARALSARLIGVDLSPRAVELATSRIGDFLPDGRARFQVGTFEETGLPDGCADGAVSMDALPFSPDRDAALAELRRILRPGARGVFTCAERLPGNPLYKNGDPTWEERIKRSGLVLESAMERPEEPLLWQRLFELRAAYEHELRAEVGDEETEAMLREGREFQGPASRRAMMYTVRAPDAGRR